MSNAVIRDGVVFEKVLDQIDAPSGSVQLITKQLIGGTGGSTEPTVHTLSQYGVCLLNFG